MREAAIGMGATPTQVVSKVVVPTALPGILTGVMLAVARAAGETAPLLFTALFSDFWISRVSPQFLPKTLSDLMRPTASLAVVIYNFSGSPFDNQIALAWSAALILVVIVLVVNVGGQIVAGRSANR
jgi:phosphate transport system permease protein